MDETMVLHGEYVSFSTIVITSIMPTIMVIKYLLSFCSNSNSGIQFAIDEISFNFV